MNADPVTVAPSGVVTFLVTDIEGSTRMWRAHPEAMMRAVERQRELIAGTVASLGGLVPPGQGEGDSVLSVFARATDAARAAVEIRLALAAESWPVEAEVWVRMALHTGEADVRDEAYMGPAVAHVGIVRDLAHGGQTLVSRATHEQLRDQLPTGSWLKDLGSHDLDSGEVDQIWQLCHEDLPNDFPPLRLVEAAMGNLPMLVDEFIGRADEIDGVTSLLQRARLITLTGAGGSGKSRLAIEVARRSARDFRDGVHIVDLTSVDDCALVSAAITRALSIHENPGASTFRSLVQSIDGKELLLLLDGFERVVEGAPVVGDLLVSCPRLTILVTSRVSLHLSAEHEVHVPPLEIPERPAQDEADVHRFEATRLFLVRARAVRPNLSVNEGTAAAIADICRRLDGLPLAIELAASRVKLLGVTALRDRLAERLDLLAGGPQDLPLRQRTLRNLMDWDYEVLEERDGLLFRRLGACAGGFTLQAAAATAGVSEVEAFDGIEILHARNLIRRVPSSTDARFRMLQTIREYAREVLVAAGEEPATRRRHAHHFLEVAESAAEELRGPRQIEWFNRLEADHDNFRAALRWAHEQPDPSIELRLTGALSFFWSTRGHIAEGRRWVEEALGRSTGVATMERARVLIGAATFARARVAYEQARALMEECLRILRELGAPDANVALALKDLANLYSDEMKVDEARRLYLESQALWRSAGVPLGVAQTLNNLGYLAQTEGHLDEARKLYAESLELFEQVGDKQGVARSLMNQGGAARDAGKYAEAVGLLEESLGRWRELGDKWDIVDCMEDLAATHCDAGDHEAAAVIFGAAETLRDAIGAPRPPYEIDAYERRFEETRAALGEEAFSEAFSSGRDMELDEAIDYALARGQGGTP